MFSVLCAVSRDLKLVCDIKSPQSMSCPAKPEIRESRASIFPGIPPTSSSLRIFDRSFRYASPCLWNQLPSSLRQPHFSPSVSALPDACSYHSFSLCQLTIHNSLSLSLPAQDLPLSQIFPSIDSLPASGLTPRTSRPDRFI